MSPEVIALRQLEMLLSKCMAGTMFEVGFELLGFFFVFKGDVGDAFPGFIFIGMDGFTGVMFV